MWRRGFYGTIYCTVCLLGMAIAGPMGDQCDWTGSGLAVGRSRGVTPVYLRCGEGRLTWLYPRGALRLIFRLPRSPANPTREFRVCLRILHDEDTEKDVFIADDIENLDNSIDIDKDPIKDKNKDPFPARLFLEGENGLVPLFSDSARSVKCFWSRGGRGAVYVEALPESASLERRVARLRYEARPARDAVPADDECRPCSDDEMAFAYCTSDFVGRGIIVGVQDQEDLDKTELTLKLTKLIRNSETAVRDLRRWDITDSTIKSSNEDLEETKSSNMSQELDEFSNEMETARHRRGVKRRKWHVRVSVPLRCMASAGAEEEYVVMARRRLGSLRLVCAPRLQQWAALKAKVNADGSGHCLLGS